MKRVLIISYYWPPTGGSGVQRWVKFAKYLPSNVQNILDLGCGTGLELDESALVRIVITAGQSVKLLTAGASMLLLTAFLKKNDCYKSKRCNDKDNA